MDKKQKTNLINKRDKCFQYSKTVALNHEETGNHIERITKVKPFIGKYNWGRINFPSEKDDWKKFEKNTLSIALNVFDAKKEKIYPAYVSMYNSNPENQAIFLMITIGEGWRYLAVKKLSVLLTRITSKHTGDFYCLNCLHSFRTKSKLESHKKVCENEDFCNITMPSEDTEDTRV